MPANPTELGWSIDCLAAQMPAKSASSWGRTVQPVERSLANPSQLADPMPAESRVLRRWEAGFTDRLNEAHWQYAHGAPINHDLAVDLPTLRARTAWELANNPIIEGMVNTHCNDLVGLNGPTLQVYTQDDRYTAKLEKRWAEWCDICDITGTMGLVEVLKLWFRGIWSTGELLCQEVTDDSGSSFPVSLRLLSLHADRLATPLQMSGDRDVALGVKRNRNGRPITYYLTELAYVGAWQNSTGRSIPVPADMIHHGFFTVEPGQVRGFPLLSSALPAIADIRDYDLQVLDAARAAADTGVWFFTTNPDGEKWAGDEGIEITNKRRTNRTAPPGWQPMQINPGHPTAQYSEHRRERMLEFGRSACIPLMMIRLDSSQHNYSSARFDHQVYVQNLEVWRSWIARRNLNRLVAGVSRELQLARELPPPPPDLRFGWGWTRPPHVDPSKERAAERIGLQNRTLTFEDACFSGPHTQEDVIASWAKTLKLLENSGFTPEQVTAFLSTLGFSPKPSGEPPATVRGATSTQAGSTK